VPITSFPSRTRVSQDQATKYVVLTGNPNCGKTTLFNNLTGLRAKVGNYAGVTVERKEGPLLKAPPNLKARVLDLPGTYSLSPQSLDEEVSRDVLLNRLPELPAPAVIVIVVDASNLQRNLYYVTQVLELGYPTIVALNMMDVARQNGHEIDTVRLAELLGASVVPVVASSGEGTADLREKICRMLLDPEPVVQRKFFEYPEPLDSERRKIADLLAQRSGPHRVRAEAEAFLVLGNEKITATNHYEPAVKQAALEGRERLDSSGVDWRGTAIEARYQSIARIQEQVTTETLHSGETQSDRLDRVVTHKVWGTLLFLLVMALMFQSIFTLARVPMDALQAGVDFLGWLVASIMPPGDLRSLLADGVIAGVGAVVVFLPQILLLFLFIGFLEDTGYMARAAFLMDRLMSKVGLHGKSFIPMLSSFACAIPGIMATRTIESPRDRLVTIMVCPLMSCAARLPVYTLLISACIPNIQIFGFLRLQGLTMLGMYLLGVLSALAIAWVFKKTLLRGEPPLLIMELPPYKRPLARIVVRHMWDRSKVFLKQAGTVILGVNIILWFLATYPRDTQATREFDAKRASLAETLNLRQISTPDDDSVSSRSPVLREPAEVGVPLPRTDSLTPPVPAGQLSAEDRLRAIDHEEAGVRLRNSFAGRMGRFIEPVIAPLGFDWKIGIGIVASFAAREVFVSTMSTVYNIGNAQPGDADNQSLVQTIRAQRRPDGTPVYTLLTGLSLMVFYVFALQCVSTVAVVKRETNSWRWPLFQWFYLAVLAWGAAFATLHIGRFFGLT
jgi:ferrous iron transport protein B